MLEMTKTVTCIRHGQPQECSEGDPCLSEIGISQASVLTGQFDLIVLSPLRRAIETYTRSNVSGSRIIVSDLAREQRDDKKYNQLRGEGAVSETVDDMYRRMSEFREFLKGQPENNICVFSSAFAICYLQQVCGYSSKPVGYTEVIQFSI